MTYQPTPDTEQKIIAVMQEDPTRRGACIVTLAAQELNAKGIMATTDNILRYARTHFVHLDHRLNVLLQIH